MSRTVTEERIQDFRVQLRESQVNDATIVQYAAGIEILAEYLDGGEITQPALDGFRTWLLEKKNYKKSSANFYIVSARCFCRAMNWDGITVKNFSMDSITPQKKAEKYISRADYQRLITTAMYFEDYGMAMLIQTLCHMDLRYSELSCMTVEAVQAGTVEVIRRQKKLSMKIPEYLRESLERYACHTGIAAGLVFRTSRGNLPDRSNAWKEIRKLCEKAGLEEGRVTLQKLKMPIVHDYYPFYPMPG